MNANCNAPMPTHIMVDIETLGTGVDAPILTIGAVCFDPFASSPGKRFYATIHPACYDKYGHFFTISYETLLWWLKQEEAPRNEAFFAKNQVEVDVALKQFHDFIDAQPKPLFMWSHGKEFDLPILAKAMNNFSIGIPWKFFNTRDTRTLFDVGHVGMTTSPDHDLHHAIGDCLRQIDAVQRGYKALGKSPT